MRDKKDNFNFLGIKRPSDYKDNDHDDLDNLFPDNDSRPDEDENKASESENLRPYQILQQMIDNAEDKEGITLDDLDENSKNTVKTSLERTIRLLAEMRAMNILNSSVGKWVILMVSVFLTVRVFLPITAGFYGITLDTVFTFATVGDFLMALLFAYFPVFLLLIPFRKLFVSMIGDLFVNKVMKEMRFFK